MYISAPTMNALYLDTLRALTGCGAKEIAPRGMKTQEALAVTLELLDPHFNALTLSARRLNYSFMAAEFLWMISGSNRVDLIEPFNKNIVMARDPGQDHFTGAYGPKIIDQLPYVIEVLREDPNSRQAILTIWRERPRMTRDVPCTVDMQFFVRDEKLRMVTHMRSNDVWLGLPYDIFNFTMIQRLVALALCVEVGVYTHIVGSLHLYERDYDGAQRVLSHGDSDESLFVESFATAPLGRVSGLFADLATHKSASDDSERYLASWWGRTAELEIAWRNLLGVAAWRFTKDIDLPTKWLRVLERRAL